MKSKHVKWLDAYMHPVLKFTIGGVPGYGKTTRIEPEGGCHEATMYELAMWNYINKLENRTK